MEDFPSKDLQMLLPMVWMSGNTPIPFSQYSKRYRNNLIGGFAAFQFLASYFYTKHLKSNNNVLFLLNTERLYFLSLSQDMEF